MVPSFIKQDYNNRLDIDKNYPYTKGLSKICDYIEEKASLSGISYQILRGTLNNVLSVIQQKEGIFQQRIGRETQIVKETQDLVNAINIILQNPESIREIVNNGRRNTEQNDYRYLTTQELLDLTANTQNLPMHQYIVDFKNSINSQIMQALNQRELKKSKKIKQHK